MIATFTAASARTLAVACLATAMLMLDIAVVNTALPYLARDLHAGLTGVQWVVDAYTLALAAVVLSVGSVAELAGATLLLAAFVGIQARVRAPMLPLGMSRRRDFTAAQIAAFAISASFFALHLYMTLYLQDVLHLSALDAGLVYLPGTFLRRSRRRSLGALVPPCAALGHGAANAYVVGLHHALLPRAAVGAPGAQSQGLLRTEPA